MSVLQSGRAWVGVVSCLVLAFPLGAGATYVPNGGFESSFTKWKTLGDAHVVTKLGSIFPREGSHMALITTGKGAYEDRTSQIVSSSYFLVPSDARTMRVRWNFLSDEYPEYVGTKYNDTFKIQVEREGTVLDVFTSTSINEAEWDDSYGTGYNGETGWQESVLDLAAYQNTWIKLYFRVDDVSDTKVDSAALIDAIDLLSDPGAVGRVSDPVIQPGSGTTVAGEGVMVSMSSTNGAQIHYEVIYDSHLLPGETGEGMGKIPNSKSPTYTKPFEVTGSCVVSAYATKSGKLPSGVTQSTIRVPQPPLIRHNEGVTVPAGSKGSIRRFRFYVPEGQKTLTIKTERIKTSGYTDDCDLYASPAAYPTTAKATKQSATKGSCTEKIVVSKPVAGYWNIMLYGRGDYSNVELYAAHDSVPSDFYDYEVSRNGAVTTLEVSNPKVFYDHLDVNGDLIGSYFVVPVSARLNTGEKLVVHIDLPPEWEDGTFFEVRVLPVQASGTFYLSGDFEASWGLNSLFNEVRLTTGKQVSGTEAFTYSGNNGGALELTFDARKCVWKSEKQDLVATVIVPDSILSAYSYGAGAMVLWGTIFFYATLLLP